MAIIRITAELLLIEMGAINPINKVINKLFMPVK